MPSFTISQAFFYLVLIVAICVLIQAEDYYTGNMVMLCLFYRGPSGHARSDPILNQQCASDHVHTFYGPQNFHPDTTYEDIRDTDPLFSSTPYEENQSLYWHPSIYAVSTDEAGSKNYTRVNELDTTPYYRWDNSVLPRTEAFPPKFRMIAYSDQQTVDEGGNPNGNLFTECCNYNAQGQQVCSEYDGAVNFPKEDCDLVGLAFAMPTCWNGNLGISNDHVSHMKYTVDGDIAGECPEGYNRRLPQIQLLVRILNYKGATMDYVLADESSIFHVDFMNGWKEGTLQNVIDNCPVINDQFYGYNPPCNCAQFLTINENVAGPVCDSDVRSLIIDEPTDIVSNLPRGTCQGPNPITKSWIIDPPLTCSQDPPVPDEDDDTAVDDDDSICVDSNEKFLLRNNWKTGKLILKSCSEFFENRSQSFIQKKCSNKVNYARSKNNANKIWAPPQQVCQATCNSCDDCYQNKKSKFLYSINNNGKEEKKKCSWLEAQSDAVKNEVCQTNLKGLYPSASEACPLICRSDECD